MFSICSCMTRQCKSAVAQGLCRRSSAHLDISCMGNVTSLLLFFPTKANKGWLLWWLWSQTWLSSCGTLGFQDWWQSMLTQFVIGSVNNPTRFRSCWCSMHTTMWVYTSFCTIWKSIESFNDIYLIFYWMLLLLLLEVNNTTIFLMASLNTIDGMNRWSLYAATLLSLLLAINNRLIWLVVMAWHPQRYLAPRVFGITLVEDKTILWYCHMAG